MLFLFSEITELLIACFTSATKETMPYLILTTNNCQLGSGPCTVNDPEPDPALMQFIEAVRVGYRMIGQYWDTPLSARKVIDRLELKGYSVISTHGWGDNQSVITLHKPLEKGQEGEEKRG